MAPRSVSCDSWDVNALKSNGKDGTCINFVKAAIAAAAKLGEVIGGNPNDVGKLARGARAASDDAILSWPNGRPKRGNAPEPIRADALITALRLALQGQSPSALQSYDQALTGP